MDNQALDIIRNGGDIQLYEFVQQQKNVIFNRLSTCDPKLEELLVVKGMALQLQSFISHLNKKPMKEKN